jgi:DNA invertase Pin-like site-specific DNA recombinase
MDSIKQSVISSSNDNNKINEKLNLDNNHVVIYIRASTKEQGVDAQKYICEEFCFNNRLYIDDIIIEKCSAYKENKQVMLDNFIKDNSNKSKNINIVVASADRFSRNIKKADELVRIMNEKNINLISVKENITLDTAFGKHEFRKLISASQYESELIAERVRNSVKYRKANNIHMGKTPYGYSTFNGKLVKNNIEQKVIRFITSNVSKETTTHKLSANLLNLLKDINSDSANNFVPIVITNEDDDYEYRVLDNNEKFKPTMKTISEILNDYNVSKRNRPWNASSVNYVLKQQFTYNNRDMMNMRL